MSTPRKPSLKVVSDQGAAPANDNTPTSVREAANSSERGLLVALRNKIAGEIDRGVPAHALAPLARQLREINRDIEAIDAKAAQEAGEDAAVPDEEWDASAL